MTTSLSNIALHGLLMEAGEFVRNKRPLEAVKLLRPPNKAVIAEPHGCFVFALAHETLGELTKALQFYDLLFKSAPDHLDACSMPPISTGLFSIWSPLMDVAGFTQALEAAYRAMWIEWCGKATV